MSFRITFEFLQNKTTCFATYYLVSLNVLRGSKTSVIFLKQTKTTKTSTKCFNYTIEQQQKGATTTKRFNNNKKVQQQQKGSTTTKRFNNNKKVQQQQKGSTTTKRFNNNKKVQQQQKGSTTTKPLVPQKYNINNKNRCSSTRNCSS